MKGFCVNPCLRLIGNRSSNIVKSPLDKGRYFLRRYLNEYDVGFRIVLVNTNVVGNYCVNFK